MKKQIKHGDVFVDKYFNVRVLEKRGYSIINGLPYIDKRGGPSFGTMFFTREDFAVNRWGVAAFYLGNAIDDKWESETDIREDEAE